MRLGGGFGSRREQRRLSVRETGAVLLSGGLLALSQPLVVGAAAAPVDETGLTGLLALVALVPALVVARSGSATRAFGLGAAALWVYLVVATHWLVIPFSVYGGAPSWAAVIAVLLATGAVAAGLAVPFAIMRMAERSLGCPAWVSFPAAVAAVELLRNYVPFGGMPWGSVGGALASVDVLRQAASLFGVHGLSFAVALVSAVLSDVVIARRSRERPPVRGLVVTGAVYASLLAYGVVRLSAPSGGADAVKVGLLQPSVSQELINGGAAYDDDIRARYHALQDEAVALGAEVIVWPEAALRPPVAADSATLTGAGVAREGGAAPPAAIVGAISFERSLDEDSGRLETVQRSSAFVTGRDLAVTGRYDKARLVPFGEYVPWPFSYALPQLVPGGPLTAGEAPRALPLAPLGGQKVGITICWDGLFPDVTRALVRDGAVQLYNLTNDAWYGRTAQPWQHLSAYALRATETARPVVRAANSGVSGWFDDRGRFHDGAAPFTSRAVVAEVPTSSEQTLYVRFGEWVALPSLVFTALLLLLSLLGGARRIR